MQILKRAASAGKKEFEVLKGFYHEKKHINPGDVITLEGSSPDTWSLFERGLILPCDMPDCGIYIAVKPFKLPGEKTTYSANFLETAELLKEDAISLLIKGTVIPKNPDQWRPRDRVLKSTSKRK